MNQVLSLRCGSSPPPPLGSCIPGCLPALPTFSTDRISSNHSLSLPLHNWLFRVLTPLPLSFLSKPSLSLGDHPTYFAPGLWFWQDERPQASEVHPLAIQYNHMLTIVFTIGVFRSLIKARSFRSRMHSTDWTSKTVDILMNLPRSKPLNNQNASRMMWCAQHWRMWNSIAPGAWNSKIMLM